MPAKAATARSLSCARNFVPSAVPPAATAASGGSVIFEVNEGLSTLLDFKYKPRLVARDGESGRGKQQYGKAGADLIVKVPPGTVVFDDATGDTLADLVLPGSSARLSRRAAKAAAAICISSRSTRQAPRIATPGTAGIQRWVRLELRLVAEAGLVGLPNAGKSTLLSALSAARPKIAPYPFTTLTPNLGRVFISDEESFTVADIPGLIEGAHLGHGLGIRFLRHLARTRMLVFVFDAAAHPAQAISIPCARRSRAFDPELVERPAVIALNKIDLVSDKEGSKPRTHLEAQLTGCDVFASRRSSAPGLNRSSRRSRARLRTLETRGGRCPS